MKKYVGIISILLLLSIIFAGCGGTVESTNDASTTETENTASVSEELDGKALMEAQCASCHGLSKVTSYSDSTDDWKDVVESMVQKGADLNDAEQEAVIKYLAESYP